MAGAIDFLHMSSSNRLPGIELDLFSQHPPAARVKEEELAINSDVSVSYVFASAQSFFFLDLLPRLDLICAWQQAGLNLLMTTDMGSHQSNVSSLHDQIGDKNKVRAVLFM